MAFNKKLLSLFVIASFIISLTVGVKTVSADCSLTTVGFTPLNDMPPGQTYLGFSGGLYPNSTDTRPAGHLAAGLTIAQNQIQPLDANGNVDLVNGKIVLLSIGMSNATDEFGNQSSLAFKAQEDLDPAKNSHVVIVDGAQGGATAFTWTDYINDPQGSWAFAQSRITAAGATTQQVQAVWLKEADAYRAFDWGTFPTNSQGLQSRLAEIIKGIKYRYPNAKITYLSGRTRAYTLGGNTAENLNPEPKAYETSFADKWVIEQQINGDPTLNYDSSKGAVVAPWLSWGPYLWTDGLTPRSDGLTWACTDTAPDDFTHPTSLGGVPKVAGELQAFFKTDPTATPWYLSRVINGTPPTCASTSNVNQGSAPLTVNFSSVASAGAGNSLVQYAWTFDDGDYSLQVNPTKIFSVPGTYNVRFTASDNLGNTATCSVPVTVNSGLPTPTPTPTPSSSPLPTPTQSPSPTPTPTPSPIPSPIIQTFTDTADTSITLSNPIANYGSIGTMRTLSSKDIRRILLKFNLSGIPLGSTIDSAILKLYVTDGSANPGSLYQVNGSWAEATTTWNNAPQVGPLLMTLTGPAVLNTTYSANITPLIYGSGEYNFYLNSLSSDEVIYRTKEGGASTKPALTVTYH